MGKFVGSVDVEISKVGNDGEIRRLIGIWCVRAHTHKHIYTHYQNYQVTHLGKSFGTQTDEKEQQEIKDKRENWEREGRTVSPQSHYERIKIKHMI